MKQGERESIPRMSPFAPWNVCDCRTPFQMSVGSKLFKLAKSKSKIPDLLRSTEGLFTSHDALACMGK